MTMRATVAGPVKDPNRNRTILHGDVTVARHGLDIKLDDGRHVRLRFDDPADLVRIAADLLFNARTPEEVWLPAMRHAWGPLRKGAEC